MKGRSTLVQIWPAAQCDETDNSTRFVAILTANPRVDSSASSRRVAPPSSLTSLTWRTSRAVHSKRISIRYLHRGAELRELTREIEQFANEQILHAASAHAMFSTVRLLIIRCSNALALRSCDDQLLDQVLVLLSDMHQSLPLLFIRDIDMAIEKGPDYIGELLRAEESVEEVRVR